MAPAPPTLRHPVPGEGAVFRVLGDLMMVKAATPEPGGAYGLVEVRTRPGRAARPHPQRYEDEARFLLERMCAFRIGERSVELSAAPAAKPSRRAGRPVPTRMPGRGPPGCWSWCLGGRVQFVADAGEPIADPAVAPPVRPISPGRCQRCRSTASSSSRQRLCRAGAHRRRPGVNGRDDPAGGRRCSSPRAARGASEQAVRTWTMGERTRG